MHKTTCLKSVVLFIVLISRIKIYWQINRCRFNSSSNEKLRRQLRQGMMADSKQQMNKSLHMIIESHGSDNVVCGEITTLEEDIDTGPLKLGIPSDIDIKTIIHRFKLKFKKWRCE